MCLAIPSNISPSLRVVTSPLKIVTVSAITTPHHDGAFNCTSTWLSMMASKFCSLVSLVPPVSTSGNGSKAGMLATQNVTYKATPTFD
ncbi:hypothetical protein PVL29_024157 [Vitis rotundifolia]|uniref:Uncharacterized protein n=1 Tax=Vitis rotundifolia TaxID=103349 RepID=A0AA38YR54_VITRO|nr:hypothetical protein PVL29_024157 [Vitis rotundifolia]